MLTDSRIPLKKSDIVYDTNKTPYQVYDIIAGGGNAITYDVTRTTNRACHYVLKEFYPLEFAHQITRDEQQNLHFPKNNPDIQKLQNLFKNEGSIQDHCLPPNNSPDGKYFFYITDCFSDKGTCYILIETGHCETLAKSNQVSALFKLLSAMRDVSYALTVLHRKALHLDISDSNILLTDDYAKLTDFGSLFLLDDSETIESHCFSFTQDFSPVELISASQGGYVECIDASADTYSICAVLFKHTVGRIYDPVFDREPEADWKTVLQQKYQGLYGKKVTSKLISILRTGLTSRYKTATELHLEFQRIIKYIKQFEHDQIIGKNLGVFAGILCGALALITVIAWCVFPRPEIVSVSGIDALHFDGDDITLQITIYDSAGINGKNISNIFNEITLEGFSATISVPYAKPETNNTDITYTILLSNIEIREDGTKHITIGDIYQTLFFQKRNKPQTVSFEGFVEEPKVIISEPTFSKVNSEAGHSVTYTVEFQVPEGQEAEIDLSNVALKNFSCGSADSKQVGHNKYEITFSEISGSTGICSFSIYEGTCKLKTGVYNRETASPSFEIVENEVENYPIQPYLHIVSQDLRDGGYILLEHRSFAAEKGELTDVADIGFAGFTADRVSWKNPLNNYILFENIKIEEKAEPVIWLTAGSYVSKANGSVSPLVEYYPKRWLGIDKTVPTAMVYQLNVSNPGIISGTDLIIVAEGSDNRDCILSKKEGLFSEEGFLYDNFEITIDGLTILAIYKNVQSMDGYTPKVILSEGVYSDSSNNKSFQVEYSFVINP